MSRRLRAVPDLAAAEPVPDRLRDTGTDADPDTDPESVARAICLRMLTNRPCTRAELATELRKRRVPPWAVDTVLERLDDVGLVDDRSFAASWVERQVRTRGLGRRALAAELRRKGVADDAIGDAVATVTDDDERARAAELIARKLPSLRSLERDKQVNRLVGMLARKGYGAGVAFGVVREALGELDAVSGDAAGDAVEPDI